MKSQKEINERNRARYAKIMAGAKEWQKKVSGYLDYSFDGER
jgi:hypothetical protein